MDLIALLDWSAGSETAHLRLDRQRCLHAIDSFAHCTACYTICPAGAIQPGKPPTLDDDACRYCRACLPICRAGAYTMADDVPALIHCAARLQANIVEVVCELHSKAEVGPPDSEGAIRVHGCLAGLGSGAYLQLVAQVSGRVIVRTDACKQCPWHLLKAQIERQITQAQHLLEAWGRTPFITTSGPANDTWVKRPLYLAGSPPVSRRDLFRIHRQEEKQVASVAGGEHPFHERLRILSALRPLPGYDKTRGSTQLTNAGFATLTIANTCTACNTCARACPSGALKLEKDDTAGQFALTFAARACLACDVCAHLCPEQAITIDHTPSINRIFTGPAVETLCEGKLVRCGRCNALFAATAADARFCPVCTFRRQNPFASQLPPHFSAPTTTLHPTDRLKTRLREEIP